MKKLIAIMILFFVSSVAFAQITGSAHDFSTAAWNTSTGGEICITCHTPHNSIAGQSPLWNHEVTTATFTPYSNTASLNATVGQPNASSKLCLSCHDGTVALDNFGGTTTGTNVIGTGGDNGGAVTLLGTDLSNDHPVSFTYDATLATADGGLYDPSTANSGLGGTIAVDMLLSGSMECASCHDVHNAGINKLLVKANTASALCLTCHNK